VEGTGADDWLVLWLAGRDMCVATVVGVE